MTVDWFLIDAPHVVPGEYATWEAAKAHHRRLFLRVLDADVEEGSDLFAALEKAAADAKTEADRLEGLAREAWKRKR